MTEPPTIIKPQTVSEGLELILSSNTNDRTETALRWIAARLDWEEKKSELIIDEAGLRERND